ncbi:MAG TPA: histidine--tRNA ligase [Rhodospirillales bacterium]|nr:histidine--tRNA ligase [Rhodospirillales bacterium]
MTSLNPVRGTQDILPEEGRLYRRVEETAFEVAERYGFGEITTPIFEFTEVFSRTLGDTSDIVTKEMYTFEDKGGDQITLRPEGTAGVARAFISNGLQQNLPLKLFYRGPMFRYERPQKGRRRQFRQVGVEILGVATPQADIETISIAQTFLEELGLKDYIKLELNSLGDTDSRSAYCDELVKYLSDHQDKLSKDSLERLDRNPMRILDSKDEGDQAVVVDAPRLQDNLNEASQSFFEDLCEGLTKLGIVFEHNTNLVRGLDYYCHTAFEFKTSDLGAQGTVLAGGRYDGLVGQMGGPETPGIGWAAGVERLSLLLDDGAEAKRPIAVIPVGGKAESEAMVVTEMLRKKGYRVDLGYSGNLKKRMKRANRLNAVAAVLLGEDELTRNVGTLRNMDSGEQKEVSLETLEDHLALYK